MPIKKQNILTNHKYLQYNQQLNNNSLMTKYEFLSTFVMDSFRILFYLSAAPTLSAKSQREINAALDSYRRKNCQEAQNRLEKVAKSAPLHPDPHYLLGMVALQRNDRAAAKAHFDKALSLYPSHARALTAYGDLWLREQNYAGAIQFLLRAVEAEPADWRSHGMLAAAYYQVKEYQKSRIHAERALELNRGQSADLRVLLAQALLGLGDRSACLTQLQEFLKSFPNDERAAGVKQALAALETPNARAGGGLPKDAPTVAAAELAALTGAWAPPDVDSVTPSVTREVPCNLYVVLQSAARRSETLVASMQRMTAAETIEHALLGATGLVTDNQGAPVEGEFSLSVVDQASLALADPNSEDILSAYYSNQPLGIETGLSIAAYTGRDAIMPGGMGGGGGGELPFIRENFPDTAYWNPLAHHKLRGTRTGDHDTPLTRSPPGRWMCAA